MTKYRGAVTVFLGVVLVAGLSTAAFAGPNVLGQVLTDDVLVDGIRVPAGTTLFSPSVVSTDSEPAVVQLGIAQVLTLDGKTTAKLESAANGVAVDVQSGSVSFLDRAGRLQERGEGAYQIESSSAPSISNGPTANEQAQGNDFGFDNDLVRDGIRNADRRANDVSRAQAADARGEKWWWHSWWNHGGHDDGGSGGHDDGGGHGDDGGGGHNDGGHGHGKQSPTNP